MSERHLLQCLPDKLQDVRLIRYDVFAVQQQTNNRCPRASQRALLVIPEDKPAYDNVSTVTYWSIPAFVLCSWRVLPS
jgi:hypothetical protein